MKWNLKSRILIPSIVLIVVISATISGVSFFKGRAMLDEVFNSDLNYLCGSGLSQVDSWMEAQRQFLTLWSLRSNVLSALQNTTGTTASRAAVGLEMQQAKQVYGTFEDIHLADASGATVASSNPDCIGKANISDRQYFKEAITGKTAISQVLASRTTGKPIVVIATPIKEGETVRGVLLGLVDLNWLSSKVIADIKVLRTGYAYLTDEQGVFIAHPNPKHIMKLKLSDFDWGRQMLDKQDGEIHYQFEGIDKTVAFKTSSRLHWKLAITAPMAELNTSIYKMGQLNLAASVGAVILGVLIMLPIVRSINRPILSAAESLSNGADQTTGAANQVSSASQSLAEGASQQAASIEETSASLEELASMTKHNADNAQKANDLARQARQAADKGAADMESMKTAVEAIKHSSDDIAKIIKTIDEIAFQTNILALNAAVEAARAGEAGMGFAVVADEVRNLAQRSAQAAKETAAKIEGAIARTAQGVEISGKVAEAFNDIVGKARQVDELVAQVSSASQEQSQGITQINTAITQMDKVTQSNAASAEESAAAAEELNAQSCVMKESAAGLLRLVGGSSAASNPGGDLAPAPIRKSVQARPSTRPESIQPVQSAGSQP
jgi:methyl-accepting chemotaxis protein